MADPVPIRDGIAPCADFAREILDFCQMKITDYAKDYDVPPQSVAIVLSGEKDGKRSTDAASWDASEKRTKLETCSVASAVLLKRAME